MKVWKRLLAPAVVMFLAKGYWPVHAFGLNDTGHGGITRDALNLVSKDINGETLKFTDRARQEIKDANFEVDHHQLTAEFHFDDEKLNGGTTRINTLKERVITESLGGNGRAARQALGGALHTIQDFFAHSNQADEGLSIPNFGTTVLTALPTRDVCTGTFLNPGSTLLPGAELTSGYFTIPLCNPPAGKCKHGLAICPGIAKDPDSHPFHNVAYNNAVTASKDFINSIINDPRMTADPKAIKRLMDIRPMLGAVIDDTGSMGPVISGVRSAVTSIVNSLIGTPDEPDKYLLEIFGDPDVGTPSVYNDAPSFISAVNAISVGGGGDCPEFSQSGAYNAVVAAENDSRLFTYTDASAKDAGLMSAVASLAATKRINVTTALSGSCSPYDPTYFELARRTGGQVLITSHNESGATLANIMLPLVRNDVHLVLQASLVLTGNTIVRLAPIDETVRQAIFTVGMISKGTINVRRPDGTLVQSTDAGVTITDTLGSRTVTVVAPVPGDWAVEITGSDVALITVTAATSTFLHKFDFVDVAGRAEHQGLFPIDGRPIVGKTQTVRAIILGSVTVPEFSFRGPDGSVIFPFSMFQNSPLGATNEDFVGEVVPPAGEFLLYVNGVSAGGNHFQRVLAGQQATSSVEVRFASDLTSVPAGRSTPVAFSVTNHGNPTTYTLSAVDSRGFLSGSTLPPITLGSDESRTVVVTVTPPLPTPPGTELAVTLTASAGTDDNSNSASIVLTVGPGNRDPVCSAAAASPSIIRQKNHKMIPTSILGVTDADNDPVQLRITAISQDEPLTGAGSGNTKFDATGVGEASAFVRAERAGTGDGRVYRIAFDATDGKGGSCSGSVTVQVPHDDRVSSVDSGSGIDSLGRK
jgi:hypothetical protein